MMLVWAYTLIHRVLGVHEPWEVFVIAVAIVGMLVVNWRAVKKEKI